MAQLIKRGFNIVTNRSHGNDAILNFARPSHVRQNPESVYIFQSSTYNIIWSIGNNPYVMNEILDWFVPCAFKSGD